MSLQEYRGWTYKTITAHTLGPNKQKSITKTLYLVDSWTQEYGWEKMGMATQKDAYSDPRVRCADPKLRRTSLKL